MGAAIWQCGASATAVEQHPNRWLSSRSSVADACRRREARQEVSEGVGDLPTAVYADGMPRRELLALEGQGKVASPLGSTDKVVGGV